MGYLETGILSVSISLGYNVFDLQSVTCVLIIEYEIIETGIYGFRISLSDY